MEMESPQANLEDDEPPYDPTRYFDVFRLPDSPTDYGYYIAERRYYRRPFKVPLIWQGSAIDADHALEQAKAAEAKT